MRLPQSAAIDDRPADDEVKLIVNPYVKQFLTMDEALDMLSVVAQQLLIARGEDGQAQEHL